MTKLRIFKIFGILYHIVTCRPHTNEVIISDTTCWPAKPAIINSTIIIVCFGPSPHGFVFWALPKCLILMELSGCLYSSYLPLPQPTWENSWRYLLSATKSRPVGYLRPLFTKGLTHFAHKCLKKSVITVASNFW